MTRDEFVKHKWKAYEVVVYKNDRMKNWDGGIGVEVECLACIINWDEETILLQCINPDAFTDNEFYANIKNIEFPKKKSNLSLIKNHLTHDRKTMPDV